MSQVAYAPVSPLIQRRCPHSLIELPHVWHLTPTEAAALTEWGFIDNDDMDCRPEWSLPHGWSIKATLVDYSENGSYSTHHFRVSDPKDVSRFDIHEEHNPAGTRTTFTILRPPTYVYDLQRTVFATGEFVESCALKTLDDVNQHLRCPGLAADYFARHDVHREGTDILTEVRRRHLC